MVGMSILSFLYDKRDCATPPPLRIISAEAMKGELSRLQGRARCIVAHPDRLQGDGVAGQDQRRVPCAGRARVGAPVPKFLISSLKKLKDKADEDK